MKFNRCDSRNQLTLPVLLLKRSLRCASFTDTIPIVRTLQTVSFHQYNPFPLFLRTNIEPVELSKEEFQRWMDVGQGDVSGDAARLDVGRCKVLNGLLLIPSSRHCQSQTIPVFSKPLLLSSGFIISLEDCVFISMFCYEQLYNNITYTLIQYCLHCSCCCCFLLIHSMYAYPITWLEKPY